MKVKLEKWQKRRVELVCALVDVAEFQGYQCKAVMHTRETKGYVCIPCPSEDYARGVALACGDAVEGLPYRIFPATSERPNVIIVLFLTDAVWCKVLNKRNTISIHVGENNV